jgi:hypothetical protein
VNELSANTYRRGELRMHGTRFRLYPQAPLPGAHWQPEIVCLSPPVGSVYPGPADHRMYVCDAIDKDRPYGDHELPPYRGSTYPPVPPGPDGHFDHLEPGTREFMAAHTYGTIRFVLDVWERYVGGEPSWFFADTFDRLELVPMVDWDNAQCGYGYIEMGFARVAGVPPHPFCLDFDVLAHELGHALVYSLLGIPDLNHLDAEYLGFQESTADCTVIVALLHFDTIVEDLLRSSRGNLYLPNELNRIGELSDTQQFRLASNSLTLADVPRPRTPTGRITQQDRHLLGLPLTGAVFDVLVEVFEQFLVEENVISRELDTLSRQDGDAPAEQVQAEFDRAYAGRHDAFKAALLDARDYVGHLLAGTWSVLGRDVTFDAVAAAMLAVDAKLTGGRGRNILVENLGRRGFEIGSDPGSATYGERAVAGGGYADRRW